MESYIANYKFIFTLAIFIMLLGCAANPEQIKKICESQVKGIYERQVRLEASIEQLSRDIQDIKALEKQREEQITKIQKRVEQSYSKLNKRVDELEGKNESSDTPSVEPPDAIYLKAESYYKEGKFEDAILEFQIFIDNYPQDSRVPLSYLKQGLSLINIGRKEEAKFFLQTLVDKFPESAEAKIAKEKLKELS